MKSKKITLSTQLSKQYQTVGWEEERVFEYETDIALQEDIRKAYADIRRMLISMLDGAIHEMRLKLK